MAEHQTTSEHSVYLAQLQALRQQGVIDEPTFVQLRNKLHSGNAQDHQAAQSAIQSLQASSKDAHKPTKKGMGWLFKSFIVAIAAVIITIVYLVLNLPSHDDGHSTELSGDEQVEILLPKGAQDVVPTFIPGESMNEAFKAKQAAQDGLLAKDGNQPDDQQVATGSAAREASGLTANTPRDNSGSTQKAANPAKERDPINELLKQKQKEASTKPVQKKATAENIDNLF